MSQRAKAFVEAWMASNVSADGYRKGDRSRAAQDMAMLQISAQHEGISAEEIAQEFPDLENHIATAQEAKDKAG